MPTVDCDRCDEPVDDTHCTHGRDLCPDCLWCCNDCMTEMADERAYDDSRDEDH